MGEIQIFSDDATNQKNAGISIEGTRANCSDLNSRIFLVLRNGNIYDKIDMKLIDHLFRDNKINLPLDIAERVLNDIENGKPLTVHDAANKRKAIILLRKLGLKYVDENERTLGGLGITYGQKERLYEGQRNGLTTAEIADYSVVSVGTVRKYLKLENLEAKPARQEPKIKGPKKQKNLSEEKIAKIFEGQKMGLTRHGISKHADVYPALVEKYLRMAHLKALDLKDKRSAEFDRRRKNIDFVRSKMETELHLRRKRRIKKKNKKRNKVSKSKYK